LLVRGNGNEPKLRYGIAEWEHGPRLAPTGLGHLL
jgi:hypothetical protein